MVRQIYWIKLIFFISLFRQIIPLVILEEGSYEKDVLFYVNLGEPQMIGGNYLNCKWMLSISFSFFLLNLQYI